MRSTCTATKFGKKYTKSIVKLVSNGDYSITMVFSPFRMACIRFACTATNYDNKCKSIVIYIYMLTKNIINLAKSIDHGVSSSLLTRYLLSISSSVFLV